MLKNLIDIDETERFNQILIDAHCFGSAFLLIESIIGENALDDGGVLWLKVRLYGADSIE